MTRYLSRSIYNQCHTQICVLHEYFVLYDHISGSHFIVHFPKTCSLNAAVENSHNFLQVNLDTIQESMLPSQVAIDPLT
jgi:hypothetical protein